jgi:hypothetical protein
MWASSSRIVVKNMPPDASGIEDIKVTGLPFSSLTSNRSNAQKFKEQMATMKPWFHF